MWRRTVERLVAFVFVLFSCTGLHAEREPGRLLMQARWVRLDVVAGKITLVPLCLGQKSVVASDEEEATVRESLAFSALSPDTATLHYRYQDDHAQWAFSVESATRVLLEKRWQVNETLHRVQYQQLTPSHIVLTVAAGDVQKHYTAETFWHLALGCPSVCEEHLFPVLQQLRPHWRLQAKADAITSAMLDLSPIERPSSVDALQHLVQQLDAPQFERRQQAEQQLRRHGQAAVAYFDTIDAAILSREQRLRMDSIRKALTFRSEDTPQRVATWLRDDTSIWLALLDRPSSHVKSVAAANLARLTGQVLPLIPNERSSDQEMAVRQFRDSLEISLPVLISEAKDAASVGRY